LSLATASPATIQCLLWVESGHCLTNAEDLGRLRSSLLKMLNILDVVTITPGVLTPRAVKFGHARNAKMAVAT
jgi:hypothetical protein